MEGVLFMNLENQVFKYYDPAGAIAALREGTLCYSEINSFNDPFETFAGFSNFERTDPGAFKRKVGILENYRILCLTRSWDNILMWSHYGKSHSGVVVGYDQASAEFNDDAVLPLKFGSVIYSQALPSFYYVNSLSEKIFNGLLVDFDIEYLEALQRIYLYKAQCWSYEEEVRVVKNVAKLVEGNGILDGRQLRVIDDSKVKSIIFGQKFRPGVLADKEKFGYSKDRLLTIEWVRMLQEKYAHAKFYQLDFADRRYGHTLQDIRVDELLDHFASIADTSNSDNSDDWILRDVADC